MICFDKRKVGKYYSVYKDYLCTFRCITYHKYPHDYVSSRQRFELLTLLMFKKWQTFLREKCNEILYGATFTCIKSDQFVLFEECFSISIDIFEKVDNDIVIPIYKATHKYDDEMVLNLYKNHLSYVTHFKNYAKRFQCSLCDKLFVSLSTLNRHQKSCEQDTKVMFKGCIFNSQKDLWQELKHFGLV